MQGCTSIHGSQPQGACELSGERAVTRGQGDMPSDEEVWGGRGNPGEAWTWWGTCQRPSEAGDG